MRTSVTPAPAGVFLTFGQVPSVCESCPRARGGIPSTRVPDFTCLKLSPYTRGYSRPPLEEPSLFVVVPVHTGVFPNRRRCAGLRFSCPRTYGGIPVRNAASEHGDPFTPCRRRYTDSTLCRLVQHLVSPVGTGISLRTPQILNQGSCSPRTYGGKVEDG